MVDLSTTIVVPINSLLFPANGVPGTSLSNYGLYTQQPGLISSPTHDHTTRFPSCSEADEIIGTLSCFGLKTCTKYFMMRGVDVDCVTLTYRTWLVTSSPDPTGALYTGIKCGPSPLANIDIDDAFVIED
jgi:hypothetical protein